MQEVHCIISDEQSSHIPTKNTSVHIPLLLLSVGYIRNPGFWICGYSGVKRNQTLTLRFSLRKVYSATTFPRLLPLPPPLHKQKPWRLHGIGLDQRCEPVDTMIEYIWLYDAMAIASSGVLCGVCHVMAFVLSRTLLLSILYCSPCLI